jgi:hemerythrin-like domain-containing protein
MTYMQTIETLKTEHEAVLGVLAHLERAADAAGHGTPIPSDVFSDIRDFFGIFVDRCHHGKEESELFPRLTVAGASALVRRLEDQHAGGRRLASDYAAAVDAYRPGHAGSGARLAAAAHAYADFLRAHIDLEDRELLPATAGLAAQDRDLVEAFDRVERERIGPGVHDRLHEMIDDLPGRIQPWLAEVAMGAAVTRPGHA